MQYNTLPQWLAEALITGKLAWDKASVTDFPHLLQQITLHDSAWSYTFIPEIGKLLLVIQLDSHWNKDFCHHLEDWPYLLIEVDGVLSISYGFSEDGTFNTISHADSTVVEYSTLLDWMNRGQEFGILPADYFQQPNKLTVHRTEIMTLDGSFSCVHSERIKILLHSAEGAPLPVNLSHKSFAFFEQKPFLQQKKPGILSWLFNWIKLR